MKIDLTIVPYEGVQGDPNVQEQEQNEGAGEEHGNEDIHEVDTDHPSYGKYPTQ